jgi:hypothetical protein
MEAYISRDEDSNDIWIWLKPKKGNWKPKNVCGKEFVNYQREAMNEINTYCCYDKTVFKNKFGVGLINKKTCKHVHLPDALVLDNVDAKHGLFFG